MLSAHYKSIGVLSDRLMGEKIIPSNEALSFCGRHKFSLVTTHEINNELRNKGICSASLAKMRRPAVIIHLWPQKHQTHLSFGFVRAVVWPTLFSQWTQKM